ncbi:uncharacterized protein [Haliotis cracherodii]|uniref:uncharacterized protein n=1 Tax=Haliotis cracherodii TaxID=6455 RepID=UPI0039EA36F8
MMVGYWTVWAAALYIGMATGQRITVTQCKTTYDFSSSSFQDKKIEKGIRRRGNATSLVECLLVCDRFSAGNSFYNRATQDCICPLGYPYERVSAPGYTYYSRPGLIGKWITVAINASSQDNEYPLSNVVGLVHGSVWKPRSDDAAPWIEFGMDTFLYIAMVQIYPDISTFTKDIWFRDSNRNWMVTWTENDEASILGGSFVPHCKMLTIPTDAVRITMDKHSSLQVQRVLVRGLM